MSKFPDKWNIGNVVLMNKGCDKGDVNNFRPHVPTSHTREYVGGNHSLANI